MNLNVPLKNLSYVTPVYAKRLKKLGLETTGDLIFYFPRRYDDFSKIIPINELKVNEVATVQGEISDIQNKRTFRRRMTLTEAMVKDNAGAVKIVWFNQPFIARNLRIGQKINLSGKITYADEGFQISNPSYEVLKKDLIHSGRLVPVYHETEGVSSKWLRWQISRVLKSVGQIQDFLPIEIKKKEKLMDISKAVQEIHFPKSLALAEEAKRRFSFAELFLIQILKLRLRKKWRAQKAYPINFDEKLIKNFTQAFPFKLTDAQRKSAWEILKDLENPWPMNRLLEGDVGSGKTIVAAIALLQTVSKKYQAAFMAPTEILARQHFFEISNLLKDFNLKIGLLTGNEARIFDSKTNRRRHDVVSPSVCFAELNSKKEENSSASREEILQKNQNGEINILIGTHSLIQEKVIFKKLALAIIDEQHRFGVRQRSTLQKKYLPRVDGSNCSHLPEAPHLLTMTATPIPRTLALAVYGDLDISLIDEMPKGRQKIITKIIFPNEIENTYQFIRSEAKKRRQIFVICPLIEESEILRVKSAKEEYEKFSLKVFPDLKVGLLHGRLKPVEKEKIMKDFVVGKIDILVSTSVVEVGIDIPNATIMMIEGAERFGLAQLHQFRGRVGRGKYQSYCFLISDSESKSVSRRLKALLKIDDGAKLAEKDLEIRGPGECFGKRQSGIPDLAMAGLSDISLIKKARDSAIGILQRDPALKNYTELSEKLKDFSKKLHLE